jgi:adenosylhomocysteinase
MIDFARGFMPALAAAREVATRSGALTGRRVGLALTLEPKTACLAEALAAVGADVKVLGNNYSTRPEVAAALAEAGLQVFAEDGASDQRVAELRDAFLDTRIEYLADDGAGLTRRLHAQRQDVLAHLRGVAEETTSGVRPLRNMAAAGALRVPCIAVNDARTGGGGGGIAAVAKGLGARVAVTEIDPVTALVAYHDGHDVAPLREAVADADFVFTATGVGHTVTAAEIALLRDGAVIAVGGAGPPELDLAGADVVLGDEVRPGVREVTTPTGATVFVIADGYCANTSAGEGNPIEIMDLSLALQLRALDLLASSSLAPGVHLLPRQIEDEVATAQLAAVGVRIDEPTAAQRRATERW